MSDPGLSDWQLDIVGDGADRRIYEKWVASHAVKNVNFYGNQNPLPYYKRSRLFMMTSLSEGWGLTLVEASQMGCVPIAYNSYASMSDIIDDGHNGVLIPTNAEGKYAQSLKSLMLDEKNGVSWLAMRWKTHIALISLRFQGDGMIFSAV